MHSILSRKTAAVMVACALIGCGTLPASAAMRKIERRVAPVYPELARRMHIGGTVRVAATVAADGSVTQAKAVSGNKLLESAAEDAVRKWKFVSSSGPSTENIDIDFEEND